MCLIFFTVRQLCELGLEFNHPDIYVVRYRNNTSLKLELPMNHTNMHKCGWLLNQTTKLRQNILKFADCIN